MAPKITCDQIEVISDKISNLKNSKRKFENLLGPEKNCSFTGKFLPTFDKNVDT